MRICRRCQQEPVDLPLAQYCGACRAILRTKPAKYVLTPERRAYLLAHYKPSERGISCRCARVLGVPKWRICRWAAELGLTGADTRGPEWTPDQDAFLERHIGRRHLNWISKKLGRSITACTVRAKRLRISRRGARDWYTAHQVAEAFGVDPSTVVRWIERGQLAGTREGQDHPGGRPCMWRVEHAAVQRFARTQRTAYTLAKVDQVFFLDLVFGGLGDVEEYAA